MSRATRGARNVWTGTIQAFKKHPVAIVVTTSVVAGGALHWSRQEALKQRREFPEGSTLAQLQDSLQTGDVVVFSRSSAQLSRPVYSALVYLSKVTGGCEWDHVGVIVRARDEAVPYVFERTFRGVQLLPFDERVCHSSANEIVVRKLMIPRSPQLLDEVDRFVAAETERDQAERKGSGEYWRMLKQFAQLSWWHFAGPMLHNYSRVAVTGELADLCEQLQDARQRARRLQEQLRREGRGKPSEAERLELTRLGKLHQTLVQELQETLEEWQRTNDKFNEVRHRASPVMFPNADMVARLLQHIQALHAPDFPPAVLDPRAGPRRTTASTTNSAKSAAAGSAAITSAADDVVQQAHQAKRGAKAESEPALPAAFLRPGAFSAFGSLTAALGSQFAFPQDTAVSAAAAAASGGKPASGASGSAGSQLQLPPAFPFPASCEYLPRHFAPPVDQRASWLAKRGPPRSQREVAAGADFSKDTVTSVPLPLFADCALLPPVFVKMRHTPVRYAEAGR